MPCTLHGEGAAASRAEAKWFFPNEEGKLPDASRVRKVFKRALQEAKLPAFRLYDLRRSFASLLLAAGAPITYVSAQLGHANPATTLWYYARWIPSKGRRWVDLLDRLAAAVRATLGNQILELKRPLRRHRGPPLLRKPPT